jgi:hypothetical protein
MRKDTLATGDLLDGMRTAGWGKQTLAEGAVLLRGFTDTDSIPIFQALQQVIAAAPFRQMITPGGHRMSVAMTNCGRAGWVTDISGYRYDVLDPASQRPWPPTPEIVRRLAERAAVQAGFMSFQPDSCLINRYEPGANNSRSIRIETSAILASRSFRFRLGCRQYSFSVANFATSDHSACVSRAETSSCGAELHGLRFTG